MHLDYVIAASNLKAVVYGIKGKSCIMYYVCLPSTVYFNFYIYRALYYVGSRDIDEIKKVLRGVKIPEFTAKSGNGQTRYPFKLYYLL